MGKPTRNRASEEALRAAARGRPSKRAGARAKIRHVLVLADGEKTQVNALLVDLEPWLRAHVQSFEIEHDVRAFYQRMVDGRAAHARPDLIVVLGGDGAILAAVRAFADDPVQTIGINFGRVGFLASVESAQWAEALAEVLAGKAVLEPRMRLEVELVNAKEHVLAVALNDAVITRGAFQGMLSIALRDGEDWVTNYRSDGLVVATPSGSTAYSMAAGGPILAPSMKAFAVTPVSPQALSHRSIVIDGDHELMLHVTKASGLTTLVVDGQGFYPMLEGDSVKIRRHPVAYPLLSRHGFDAYRRLRDRLGWRGSFEPDVFPDEEPQPNSDVDTGLGGHL
jgi:NAD+ kinase